MKKSILVFMALVLILTTYGQSAEQEKDLKVYISVDMEGVSFFQK